MVRLIWDLDTGIWHKCLFFMMWLINEPGHDKTYNKTCVTRKDSDQPAHLPSMARALVLSIFE